MPGTFPAELRSDLGSYWNAPLEPRRRVHFADTESMNSKCEVKQAGDHESVAFHA
jgi:hypothetical protein